MKKLAVHINVDSDLYLKDPESSELGRTIVSQSIMMINELGFEKFTFKKLGERIGSNESSIYRYFSNKHMLLVYLIAWYWHWVEYRLVFATNALPTTHEQLEEAIHILTRKVTADDTFSYIDEVSLFKIIIAESNKAYHTINVDDENAKGYFKAYKNVVERVSLMVLNVNASFEFPNMLVSTVIEGAHQQRFFSKHLPSLTDVEKGKDNIVNFYTAMVFKTIGS